MNGKIRLKRLLSTHLLLLLFAISSSQSRITKLEEGNPGISLDLMIKALLRLGTTKKLIGKLLEGELETA